MRSRGRYERPRPLATESLGGLTMTDSKNTMNPRGFPPWRVWRPHPIKEMKLCRRESR
jgi:hypothetical protein